MTQPTPYVPNHDYSAELANAHGEALDEEFLDLQTTTDRDGGVEMRRLLVALLFLASPALAGSGSTGCQWHVNKIASLGTEEAASADFDAWHAKNPESEDWYLNLVRIMISVYYKDGPEEAMRVCRELANGRT